MTRPAWFPWALAVVAAGAVAIAFRASFASMAYQWESSSTFSYGVLIAPLSLFLAWRERRRLATVPTGPGWLPLLLALPVAAAWAVATLLDVNVVQHFAAVLMLILAIWAAVGTAAARVLWFPLAYLLLMVPFGEALVPTLMQWTADFAVLAVSLSGVPVYQDGYIFSLPTVDFEVIKACSGIRFLMATVAAGTIFAWVAYTSWRKRLLFLLACLVVPVAGNLARAYLVVMMVHLSDGRLAGAHILYGTVFFGAILVAMFLVAARYADPAPAVPPAPSAGRSAAPDAGVLPAAAIALLALFVAAATGAGEQSAVAPGTGEVDASPLAPAGWTVAGPVAGWRPDVHGASAVQGARYRRSGTGLAIDAQVAWYAATGAGAGDPTDGRNRPWVERDWRRAGGTARPGYTEVVLRAAPREGANEGGSRLVWWWFAVNGEATPSPVGAKLAGLRAMIRGEPLRQGYVALSVAIGDDPTGARRELEAFAPDFCAAARVACPSLAGAPATRPD